MDQSGWGSGRAPTQAQATLQLAVVELQYVLQHIVIDKIIVNKKLVRGIRTTHKKGKNLR